MTAPVDLRPILSVHVVGTPRPKGSMRHVGNGRLVEQLAKSPDWRRAVVDAAYRAIRCDCDEDRCDALKPGYPYAGAVKVAIRLEFVPPRKPQPFPATRTSGDADKQARNILDALQDAGVVKDDAAVVDLCVSKRYSTTGVAGARIVVWPAAAIDDLNSTVDWSAVPGIPLPGGAADRAAAARRGSGAMVP